MFKARGISMNDPSKITITNLEKPSPVGVGGTPSKRVKREENAVKEESVKKHLLNAENCMNDKSSVMPSSQNPNNSLSFGNNESEKTPTHNDAVVEKKKAPQFGSQMSNGGRILPLPSPN